MELPPGISWAEKYDNAQYKEMMPLKMETHASLSEAGHAEPNNTIQATMAKNPGTPEIPEENNIIPHEKSLEHHQKSQTPQTTVHTYYNGQYPNMATGEFVVHHPAPVIIKRRPTNVYITYPPLVVKPSPVIFHRPAPTVVPKVIYKKHPQQIKIQPMFIRVIKPTKKEMVRDDCHDETATDNRNYAEYL